MISFSLFILAVLVLALALFVWRARPDNTTNRWFAIFTVAGAGWVLGVAGLHSGSHLEVWGRLTFVSASLIPATLFCFAYSYPTVSHWPSVSWVRATLLAAGVFAALSLATSLITYDPQMTEAGIDRKSGPLYPVFALYFIVTWTSAIGICLAKWRKARGRERLQLQYLGAALLLSGTGGIAVNLLTPLVTGHSMHSWIGPYFGLVLVALVAHAIIRHRLMDLRLVIHRGLTLAIAMLVSLVPVAALIMFAWPRLSLHLETHELVILLGTIAGVSLLIPLTRDGVGRLLDRYVYRTHANYQRTVREASEALTRVLDLKALLPFLTHTVVTSTQSEGVAIYLKDRDGFRRAAREAHPKSSAFEAPDRAPATVVRALTDSKDLLVTDEILRERATEHGRRLHEELTRLNWALLLPLISESTLIGVIAVGPKLSGDPFYPQDLDLLMTLANQAGVAVKNAQLYAQVVLANEYITNIVATIESGVVAIEATGEIALFNRAAAQLTGIPADRTLGQPVTMLPACLSEALQASVAEGRALTQPEIELSDGTTTRPIICTTSPLRDPEGAVLGAVAVFSDLTPLKELEAGRRHAERLADFEMLASGIAHEIKNPLVAIKTFAQLLPRRHTDARFVEEFGRIAAREIGRMERLLERLGTLSRPSDRPRHPLDLRLPIGDALETMRAAFEEKDIVVSVALGLEPCTILGDHAELEQLFLNLLMNAHEATPPRGMLRVELAVTGGRATAAVIDTGPGVPAALLERVFEPFFTTKQRGSGLGLAICAAIAQTHGAKLSAANRRTGGAVFMVEFPVPAEAPVTAGA
ncbi:MAG: GAF domain-containing protein [Candidatus Rokubacteria bacterium]|nr:GAF domain-containing protein [Candidatus Rokubacteria bacterium]